MFISSISPGASNLTLLLSFDSWSGQQRRFLVHPPSSCVLILLAPSCLLPTPHFRNRSIFPRPGCLSLAWDWRRGAGRNPSKQPACVLWALGPRTGMACVSVWRRVLIRSGLYPQLWTTMFMDHRVFGKFSCLYYNVLNVPFVVKLSD